MSRHLRCPALSRRPTVSVVIPCYNYGHYLEDAVGSVLSQEHVDADVVIVDDASTDDSAEVAAALAESRDRVQLIRHPKNRGHIATYNDGLAAVSGEYAVLLSADDLLTPGALGRAVQLMEAEPGVGLVYGHPVSFTSAPPAARTHVRNWTVWGGAEWIAGRCQRARNCTSSPEVVMRTSVQRVIGDYRADLPHSGDFEMWMRAATVADVGRVNGADQAFYRVHDDSMLRTTYSGWINDLEGRRDAFLAILDRQSRHRRPPNADALLSQARRGLAVEALTRARRAPGDGSDSVERYRAFALETYPAARDLRAWAALDRAGRRSTGPRPSGPGARLVLRLQDSFRWHRWRWSGE